MKSGTRWLIGGSVVAAVALLWIRKASATVNVAVPAFSNQTLPVAVKVGQSLVLHVPAVPHLSLSYGPGIVGDPVESPDGTTITFPVTGNLTSPGAQIITVGDGSGNTTHIQLNVS